jgi:hypothetical protein
MLSHRDPRSRPIDAKRAYSYFEHEREAPPLQLHAKRAFGIEYIKENSLLLFTVAMLASLVFCGAMLTAKL